MSHKHSCYRIGSRWILGGLVLALGLVGFAPQLMAQKVYSPEHPDVEEMVSRAVEELRRVRPDSVGEATLGALAIVEASKRYRQEVPYDEPAVEQAIERVLATFRPEDEASGPTANNVLKHNELYYPALALILLAEYDDVKYADQIKQLIKMFESRQHVEGAFGYMNQDNSGDTSQTQYASLALFIAKHHNFQVDPDVAKKTLQWLIATQNPLGGWVYKVPHAAPGVPGKAGGTSSMSMHAAGLGTCYLLADFLQLAKRKKSLAKSLISDDTGLPPTVLVYVKPKDGEESMLNKVGPLVSFDSGRLQNCYRAGNTYLNSRFTVDVDKWGLYYLYAFERYAYFREQAEGNMGGGKMTNWYDDGVELLKTRQTDSGLFTSPKFAAEKDYLATSFAILFLVRSSEVLTQPGGDSELLGGIGFKKNTELRAKNGVMVNSEAEKNLNEMMEMMKQDGLEQEQLAMLTKSLKKAIVEFKQNDNKSRGEIKAFLRSMVAARNYYRRLIAVRFLGGEQDMDNVPALIYALGDPDFRICLEAHNGLRLISRRIDSLSVDDLTQQNAQRDPGVLSAQEKISLRSEFDRVKKEWTEWFLKIRPDAELLD